MTGKKRVAILISGRGSNMAALVKAAQAPDYPAEIVAVISNRPDAAGLVFAQDNGLSTDVVDHKGFPTRLDFETALHDRLMKSECDLLCLAGFMRILSPEFVGKWQNSILNIHPSLLPSFKGLHTHEQAIEAGVKISGCTVHLVSADLDDGPIIAQAAVPVFEDDTAEILADRILVEEHALYPFALGAFASGLAHVVENNELRSRVALRTKTESVAKNLISPTFSG